MAGHSTRSHTRSDSLASLPPTPPHHRSNLIMHFMRHANPVHKIDGEWDLTMRDPGLSDLGEYQCLEFARQFAQDAEHITHILSSPMRRTLSTACMALAPIIARGIKVIALPELQNLDPGPSGRGLNPGDLARVEGFIGSIQLEYMCDGWNDKEKGKWSTESLQWRINHMRGFLRGLGAHSLRKKVEIVVVTHGSFLMNFFGDVKWGDVVMRSFTFDEHGQFVELPKSRLMELRANLSPAVPKVVRKTRSSSKRE